jgi:pimeloyl-ACP methyl ester carboxylesterase
MDLPCDDTSASFDDYADVVCTALDDCDEDVVLVGHSMGGGTVPLVAARRPVQHVVYLCAYVPAVGRTLNDETDDVFYSIAFAGLRASDGRTTWADLETARTVFYADCEHAIADAALRRLRPQARYPSLQLFSLAELPAVSSTYVVCSEDQIIRPDWSRRVARDRLGLNAVELPGSHSPMLSRPQAVADVLLGLV